MENVVGLLKGKKYYLLNLPEEERATQSIANILRYGVKLKDGENTDFSEESPIEEPPKEEPPTT